MDNISKILRDKRKETGISLTQVSASTKIHVKFLEAIEQEQFELFKTKSSLLGFTRTYAKFLKINNKQKINELQNHPNFSKIAEQAPMVNSVRETSTPFLSGVDLDKKSFGLKNIFFLLMTLLIGFGFYYFYKTNDENIIKETTIDKTTTAVPVKSKISNTRSKMEETVYTKDEMDNPLFFIQKDTDISKEIFNINDYKSKQTPYIFNQSKLKSFILKLDALSNTNVKISNWLGDKLEFTLKAGSEKELLVLETSSIFLSNGGGVLLTKDGIGMDIPGSVGQPKVLHF